MDLSVVMIIVSAPLTCINISWGPHGAYSVRPEWDVDCGSGQAGVGLAGETFGVVRLPRLASLFHTMCILGKVKSKTNTVKCAAASKILKQYKTTGTLSLRQYFKNWYVIGLWGFFLWSWGGRRRFFWLFIFWGWVWCDGSILVCSSYFYFLKENEGPCSKISLFGIL